MRPPRQREQLLYVWARLQHEHGPPFVQRRDVQLRMQLESPGLQRGDRDGQGRL
jgi:hypothetical protein